MRTLDDCIDALTKVASSQHYAIIKRGVAHDTITHLLKLKDKKYNCFECDTPLLGPICRNCNPETVTVINRPIVLWYPAFAFGIAAGAIGIALLQRFG